MSNPLPPIEFDPETQTWTSNKPQKWYAFVLGTDVVWMQTVDASMEYLVAVMSSNPKIIEVPNELAGQVLHGWSYDGASFTPPSE